MNGVSEAPERCQACGQPRTDGDPLVFAAGRYVHESEALEPEFVRAAAEMGVDPWALRRQLDSADLTPPRPGEVDDLPKSLARN